MTRYLVETMLVMSSDATWLKGLRLKNESAGMRRRSAVAVSDCPSASRPTLRSDDNRVMLTDEWLHRSTRKAQVWAVALAGRPLYAEDSDALSGWRSRRTRRGSKKLRLKKRECRDETQKRGTKRQVRRVRLSMGIGLAERSIRAHNLLEYMDR